MSDDSTGEWLDSIAPRLFSEMVCTHEFDAAVCPTCWENIQRVCRVIYDDRSTTRLATARAASEQVALDTLATENRWLSGKLDTFRDALEAANDQLEKQLADLEQLRAENDRLRAPLTNDAGEVLTFDIDGYGYQVIWATDRGNEYPYPVIAAFNVSKSWWPLIVERLCGPQT